MYKIYNLVAVFNIVRVSYCKEAEHSQFSLYKHDTSHPICRHSFYRDPCGHTAVGHNYVCSEYTICTLLVSLISVAKSFTLVSSY